MAPTTRSGALTPLLKSRKRKGNTTGEQSGTSETPASKRSKPTKDPADQAGSPPAGSPPASTIQASQTGSVCGTPQARGPVVETPQTMGTGGKGKAAGSTTKSKSNWNVAPYPEEELEWAFDEVTPRFFKRRHSTALPRQNTATEQGSPIPPEYEWVGEPRAKNPPDTNSTAGLEQSRSKVLAALGCPPSDIPALSIQHTQEIIEHFFGNPEEKRWQKLRDGKSRLFAQPATHAVLFWTAGVTELMRYKYDLFAPKLWANKSSYAFKAAEAFLSGVIGYLKDSEESKRKAAEKAKGRKKPDDTVVETLQQKKDRLLPSALHNFPQLNEDICFQFESRFDGKTTLTWEEGWAWEDGASILGRGLQSRLRQDIAGCEETAMFSARVKVDDTEEIREEITVTDGYYRAMIDSQDRLNRIVDITMRFGTSRAGGRRRIEIIGEFEEMGKGKGKALEV